MLSAILWTVIVALVVFWIIGVFFTNLGQLVWIALVVAAILAVYDLMTRGRTTI